MNQIPKKLRENEWFETVHQALGACLASVDFDNYTIYDELLNYKTSGQAHTCLLGLENIDLNKPLIISACDNGLIYKFNNLKNLILCVKLMNYCIFLEYMKAS